MSIQWMALLGSLTSCCPGQKRKLQFFFLSPDADSPVWGRKTATGLVFHWCPSVPGDGSSAAGLCFLSHSPLSWCPRPPSPLSKFLLLVCPKARGNIWVFGVGVSSMPSVNSSLFCWELETCSNSCVPSLCLFPNPHLLWMRCPGAAVFHCPPPGFHCSQFLQPGRAQAALMVTSHPGSARGASSGVFLHSLPAPEGFQVPSDRETP